MPFVLCHLAAEEKGLGVLKQYMPVFWSSGNVFEVMEADTNGLSHGANLQANPKNYSIITDHIIPTYEQLIETWKLWANPEYEPSMPVVGPYDYPRLIRRIFHYSIDACTIGQISGPEFWGSIDDRIDGASEFVRHKQNLHNSDLSYAIDVPTLTDRHKDVMDVIFKRYYKDAKDWGYFVSPREVTNMVRVAVVNGGNLGASWVYLAWLNAGKPTPGTIDRMPTKYELVGSYFDDDQIDDQYYNSIKPRSSTHGLLANTSSGERSRK